MKSTPTRRAATVLGLVLMTAALAACNGQNAASGSNASTSMTPQDKICTFGDLAGASHCKPGELMFFSPDVYGNESLPVTIIAAYCDTNRPVLFNKAGVVCTFTDKRGLKALLAPQASAPAASSSGAKR